MVIMKVQKVKDLEQEVITLKELMMEVHKNQIELSKVLLEKGIYSRPIIKLTDPKMLEEETQAVKTAALQGLSPKNSSEKLQVAVSELKKKCTIKNRMILALLKGLRSNVPKEWWEQLVDCLFNESKPIEEFDCERVDEFIRQTSLYLIRGKEASTRKLGPLLIPDPTCKGNSSQSSLTEFVGGQGNGNVLDLKCQDREFIEAITKKRKELAEQTERLSELHEPKCTSSFIQNILFEDSQAGVAVVDLFVAVKRAKDKLNLLTKVNNETWRRMKAISKESGIMKTDYRELVENVNDFFDQMSETTDAWGRKKENDVNHFSPAFEESIKNESCKEAATNPTNIKADENTLEKINETSEQNSSVNGKKTSSCFILSKAAADDRICKLSDQTSTVHILNKSPENILAALIVSSLKNKNYTIERQETKEADRNVQPNQEGSVNLSKLNVQVICDVCEILSVVSIENRNEENGRSCQSLPQQSTTGENLFLEASPAVPDEEDHFEEALTDPQPPQLDLEKEMSVTCMGDLTKTGRKKNVSTITTHRGPETSWIAKLTDDIKSKLRNLRPNVKKQISQIVDVEADKNSKSDRGLEFTISAKTPVGVFDVTIRQYKQPNQRRVNDCKSESNTSTLPAALQEVGRTTFVQDSEQYWSDESFLSKDTDQTDAASGGEEEMEEFLEVFVQSQNAGKATNKESIWLEKGTMLKTTIKVGKTPMFEIERYNPKYFVQEILPKKVREAEIEEAKVKSESEMEANTDGDLDMNEPSDDLVIYIQVEVDEEENETDSKKIYIECESTRDSFVSDSGKKEVEFKVLKQVLSRQKKEVRSITENKSTEMNETFRKEIVFRQQTDNKFVKYLYEPQIPMDTKVVDVSVEEMKRSCWEKSTLIRFMQENSVAVVWYIPSQMNSIERFEFREEEEIPEDLYVEYVEEEAPELQRAMDLIHQIENNVVDVKLSDAILILPALESELRKHLHNKMRKISEGETSPETSLEDFFSAVKFWPDDAEIESQATENSEDRLVNLYSLLSSLEDAVKANEMSFDKFNFCDYDSSRIHDLLQALTQSIKDLENEANVTNLAETVNIASKLDAAVRDYDSVIKRPLTDCTNEMNLLNGKSISAKEQMINVRKKVFQTVEDDAIRTEGRIERDFDRIDRLERENEEALSFIEAFLEKTTRRSAELNVVKEDLKSLSLTLKHLYAKAVNHMNKEKARTEREAKLKLERGATETGKEEPVRDTVSGLLLALNRLKIKAREKNNACRKLLESTTTDAFSKVSTLENKVSRCSRSSFTAKTDDSLFCLVKDFRRIGDSSLYMAWSMPEGCLSDSVTGYEVFVNDKLNQKVRNPQRTQAVLYTIDLSRRVDVQLYGLVENGPKVLLAAVTHYDT